MCSPVSKRNGKEAGVGLQREAEHSVRSPHPPHEGAGAGLVGRQGSVPGLENRGELTWSSAHGGEREKREENENERRPPSAAPAMPLSFLISFHSHSDFRPPFAAQDVLHTHTSVLVGVRAVVSPGRSMVSPFAAGLAPLFFFLHHHPGPGRFFPADSHPLPAAAAAAAAAGRGGAPPRPPCPSPGRRSAWPPACWQRHAAR